MALSPGAVKLPMRHVSIRVPWHDNRWNGTICSRPKGNAACLVLGRIRSDRNDAEELELAGRPIDELPRRQVPPCLEERVTFMSPRPYTRIAEHAYAKMGKASHAHFAPTEYRHQPYSAACIPFRWTLREGAQAKAEQHGITGYRPDVEAWADGILGWTAAWVQVKENQAALLDSYFSAFEPEKSLCFFYAKRTPLSDDPRRVIVGVGRVLAVGGHKDYDYKGPGDLRSMLWERDIVHSIREGSEDGFLMPYHQILDATVDDPEIDPAAYVAFAPDDAFDAFSYGSEHVSHEEAIAALLNCLNALELAQPVVGGDEIGRAIAWINVRLNDLWTMRGPHPGLGSALTAYGLERGTLLAYEIGELLKENEDPWPTVEELFLDPVAHGEEWVKRIDKTLATLWHTDLPDERKALLKLLSRFSITADQAKRLYQPDLRLKAGIKASDAELLANPYLLYELDRGSKDAIPVQTVDLGVFADAVVREKHPLPERSAVESPSDPRRARALMVAVLEAASADGHTVRDLNQVLEAVRGLNLKPECAIGHDLMPMVEKRFDGLIERVAMADGTPAYQLNRLAEMGKIISDTVRRRAGGARLQIVEDWGRLLAAELKSETTAVDEAEATARREKEAALEELAASRISVLIGAAGTGKTTLLSVLAKHPAVAGGGVLLLAPTGKARVQLERRTRIPAQTIAQFLVKRGQYRWETGAYERSTHSPETAYKTVVIDEASMLTEEQLGATLSAFSGVQRLILVGDPRQLPPIGPGRPFVDIVNLLKPTDIEQRFPRVGAGYAELTIRRRTQGEERDDVLLAEWFSGQPLDPGADQIWSRIAAEATSETLELIKWTTEEDLHERLTDALVRELNLSDAADRKGFEQAIGGTLFNDEVYFHPRRDSEAGAGEKAEGWQILSPVNGRAHGVDDLNRLIQRQFRRPVPGFREWRTPEPMGEEEILYGDKVINLANQRRKDAYPDKDALHYVANGEIGIAVGRYKGKTDKSPGRPWNLEVEFSSQPGVKYGFTKRDFSAEGSATLALAYAITIHKSQGSEFGTTFLVLPDPLPMMSRELLYTALTRQRTKVIVLHQGPVTDLKRYDAVTFSETIRRQTNLFAPPEIVAVDNKFLEAKLIHRTSTGIAVRSKSEVIIADRLQAHGVPFAYEQPLPGPNNAVWYPDFTVDDAETGAKVYWEHLGLLHDPAYKARWDRKLASYRAIGIAPHEEGGGSAGALVTTRDDEQGGIDAQAIDDLIRRVFDR